MARFNSSHLALAAAFVLCFGFNGDAGAQDEGGHKVALKAVPVEDEAAAGKVSLKAEPVEDGTASNPSASKPKLEMPT